MKLYHTKHAYLSDELAKRIDEKWHRLKKTRPLSPTIVSKLQERFMLEMTYNSNAIEGNNLTLKETFLIINEDITIKGKSLKNHLEVRGHQEALEFIYELVEYNKNQTISAGMIRQIQSLIISPVDKNIAGNYRLGEVAITGSKHNPPSVFEIPYLISKLLKWYKINQAKLHPIELASIFHHKLVAIHPFEDGNGRTARLLMNIILMQSGYPLVIILKNDRKKYYDTLAKADDNNYHPFVDFVARSVEKSLNIYLETITKTKSKSEKFLPLSVIAKKTKFSAKYLNLLARYGKIDAHKVGRNWVTSLKAIEKYLRSKN